LPFLNISGLNLQLKGKTLLRDVSLQMASNERVALVGESGSGKSLTALSLLGLQPKTARLDAKELSFKKQSLLHLSERSWRQIRARQIGMIFQEPQSSLNPSMRCGKQLQEVLQLHTTLSRKQQREKIDATLEEVQLYPKEHILNAYPHALSGGQKQRLMIAMALLCQPELLLADEPTTALDVTVQKEILELLLQLQKKHQMSILFISHDLALVKTFAERVVVMKDGQIVETNTATALFKNPKNPYTKGLLFARPDLQKRFRKLPTVQDYQNQKFKPQIISVEERAKRHQKLYQKKPLLDVLGLQKTHQNNSLFGFGKKKSPTLQNFSFSLYPGETLGLVGASGSGKSTLGQALLFLDPPEKGIIHFEGNQIDSKNLSALRKDVQYIFQDPYAALHPQKTVGAAIEETIRVHHKEATPKMVQERMLSLLEQTGLEATFAKRFPHELSGGQRQRVVIARALAPEPKLVICDECVAALDISVQAQVLNLLNRLKNELNLSYLFISHDLSVVKYMSDRVMVIHEGKQVELQEADQLYKNPQSKHTIELIKAIP
jgi:peptide/nickel transport system ATP-binding protein